MVKLHGTFAFWLLYLLYLQLDGALRAYVPTMGEAEGKSGGAERESKTVVSVGLTVQTSQSLPMDHLPAGPESALAPHFHTPTCHILKLPDAHFANTHCRTNTLTISYYSEEHTHFLLLARLFHHCVTCTPSWLPYLFGCLVSHYYILAPTQRKSVTIDQHICACGKGMWTIIISISVIT